MADSPNYELILNAVAEWPVEQRIRLIHALVDGLNARATPRSAVAGMPSASAYRAPAADPAPDAPASSTQAEQWAEEAIEERYRRRRNMG